jgi:hypothetical protein
LFFFFLFFFVCVFVCFISVQDTGDVIGKRFLTWEDEGFRKRKKDN